jgi:TolA-binding protein
MEIMKKVEMLEIKSSINQIRTTVDSIISGQNQAEERILHMEDKIEEISCAENNKENKINTSDYNIQELWSIIQRPNLKINGVEEGAEIQTKGIGNLFNEITAENFPM